MKKKEKRKTTYAVMHGSIHIRSLFTRYVRRKLFQTNAQNCLTFLIYCFD